MTSAASKTSAAALGGGLAVTGNYPGKARTPDELRADLETGAFASSPASIGSTSTPAMANSAAGKSTATNSSRSTFQGWIDWAKAQRPRPRLQPHLLRPSAKPPTASPSSHRDKGIRQFWIEHGIALPRNRRGHGQALGTPCVTNVWIPDGFKDTPADRKAPRERLAESLDAIFKKPLTRSYNLDAVEPQALRHRRRESTSSARTNFISATPSAAEAALPRRRPLSPHRKHRRQDLQRAPLPAARFCCTSAAACAGTATMS